jgi:tripartite-type tricarboxylate transporter receptor subunit TctC
MRKVLVRGARGALGVLLALALLPLGDGRAWSADYPVREIEMIVSFPAGGPADTSARILAP